MSIPGLLDHIVIAGPDLQDVVDRFADLTGVTAAPGGAHPTGTANALVGLTVGGEPGPRYLELIGPDPARAQDDLPTTFGIDRLEGPTLVTYAVHPADIEGVVATARSAGYDPGDVRELSRRTPGGTLLRWRLTRVDGSRRFDAPFLIDWDGTPNPGLGDLPRLELLSFERTEPDPDPLRRIHTALGLGGGVASIRTGAQPRFELGLRTPDGREVRL